MILDPGAARAAARRHVGVPFLEHGRDPSGWDCWGLYRFIATELGLGEWPGYDEAYDRADGEGATRVAAAIEDHLGAWECLARPVPGAAILFRRFGKPFHIGFALGRTDMLHVTRQMTGGTTIERFDSIVWQRFFAGAWMPKDMSPP